MNSTIDVHSQQEVLVTWYKLLSALILSALGGVAVSIIIPSMGPLFINANLCGVDMSKRDKKTIPEAMGVVCAVVYLIVIFLLLPVVFLEYLSSSSSFPYRDFYVFTSGPLTVCCMIFLGFADDVLNLRWRYKLVLPLISSIQLLMTYALTGGSTTVVVPWPFRGLLHMKILNIGALYYVYMAMLGIFCTNAINILAGINGLEVGQSVIIALSVLAHNAVEWFGPFWRGHLISGYFLLPYIGVTVPLLVYNWYPSRVFVGDTFCYFSGMLFAVVAIQGHFSKTLLLLFIPQVLNFVYSLPQLFHFIPCPRHRLPSYNSETDKVSMSYSEFRVSSLSPVGRVMLWLVLRLGLVHSEPVSSGHKGDDRTNKEQWIKINNMTLINAWLRFRGPLHECQLTVELLTFQCLCSAAALLVRYPIADYFFS